MFIPNKKNNYKPHFFRPLAVAVMVFLIGLIGVLILSGGLILNKTNLLAEIRTAFLIDLTNEDRADQNLHQLIPNPLLTQAAALKAKHMVENNYFDHTSPDGIKPWQWLDQVGYDYAYAGENLAIHFIDSEKVHDAWMNSPSHRANILQDKFTEIGIATAIGTYNGKTTTFVVQMFGRPRLASVVSRDVSLIRDVNAWVAENYLTRLLGPLENSLNKFEAGDRVQVNTTRLNVRRLPGGDRIDQVTIGTVGTVVSGPETSQNLTWWNVDFYDQTNLLLDRADNATVLGQAISQTDENTLTQAGISLFISKVDNEAELAPVVAGIESTRYTKWYQKLILSPYNTGQTIFIILAMVIASALGLLIGIEIKKQSPKHILVGLVLFTTLIGLIIWTSLTLAK